MKEGRYMSAPTDHFLREFKKLPAQVRDRIVGGIEDLLSNPHAGVRLRRELQGLLRWRMGDYRVIYKIDERAFGGSHRCRSQKICL